MAKVFLDSGEKYTVSSNSQIFGNTGAETLLISGTPNITVASTVERIEFSGALNTYTFAIAGNVVTVSSGTSVVATITVADAGQKLAFTNGSADLKITGLNAATLGGVAVPTTAAAVAATLLATDVSIVAAGTVPAAPTTVTLTTAQETKVLTAGNDTVDASVVGSLEGDTIVDSSTTDADVLNATIQAAISNATTVTNVETVNVTDRFGSNSVALDKFSGVKSLTVDSTYGFTETVSAADGNNVANIAAGARVTTLTATGVTNNVSLSGTGLTTLSVSGKTADTDAATVVLKGNTLALNVGATALKTVNLNSTTAANTVTLGAGVTNSAGSTIATSGDQNLTIRGAAADLTATKLGSITKGQTGTATLNVAVTSVVNNTASDLSKIAADNFTVSGAVTMGTGNLTFKAGTDNVTLSSNVIDGTGALVATGTATTDVLNLTLNANQTNLVTTGFETVNITNATGATLNAGTSNFGATAAVKVLGAADVTLNAATFKSLDASALTGTSKLSVTTAAFANAATITGTANNDTVDGTLATGALTITTGEGNDTITGGTAADNITVGGGNNTINTGNGNNFVITGNGNNAITLGTGNDTVLLGNGTNNVSVAITSFDTSDNLIGGTGTNNLILTGTLAAAPVALTLASSLTGFSSITTAGVLGQNYTLTLGDAIVAAGKTLSFTASGANTTAISFDGSAETDGKYSVAITTTGAGSATVKTGAGADSIDLSNARGAANAITAGKGADSIKLTGNAVVDTINQAKGDSGTLTAVTTGQSTSTFDVVTGFATGDKIVTSNANIVNANFTYLGGGTGPATLANDSAYQIRGTYDSTLKTFTAAGGGADSLFVYDSDATAATQFEAIVVVGVSASQAVGMVAGTLTGQ